MNMSQAKIGVWFNGKGTFICQKLLPKSQKEGKELKISEDTKEKI